jgi:hypothetical protein
LALFAACALLNTLIFGGFVCCGICSNLLIILYRQRLRERLGLKSWQRIGCVFDFVYVCCCPCCAISQEAQVVRYAYQQHNSPAVAASPLGQSPAPTRLSTPTHQPSQTYPAPAFSSQGTSSPFMNARPYNMPPTSM